MRHSKLLIGSAALLLAGVANAQVSVYGLVDLSYGKNEVATGKGSKVDFHSGGDNGSSQGNSTTRLGVKASTEVAPGVKANANFETAGITSDGSVGSTGTPFFNRQAWAGLSGSLGEVRLGKQDSVAFQTQIAFDFNGAANAASAFGNAGVAAWAPGRQDRSLQYISPVFGGVKVQVGFQPEGNAPVASTIVGDTNKSTASVGLTYTAGALSIGAAAETKRTEKTTSFASLAASYDLGVVKGAISYADGGKLADNGTGTGWGVGVTAPVAGYTLGLNYGRNTDTKVKAVEAYVNREVFKNTSVYLDLGRKYDTSVNYNIYALGAIYAF
ncbi:MAG: porin [Leptothrix sp. (in: b-proteobacteria)]